MQPQPVIAVIDVGKTNKKLFLFDQDYTIVYQQTARFIETVDEDGDPCENLESLRLSVLDSLHAVCNKNEFDIRAINFSAYGASFVYIDENGTPLAPLYNYLKPYPESLKKQFYDTYGGEEAFSLQTASPVLGSLNSGMQLYRLKQEKPALFEKIKYALHLPQYLSYIVSGNAYSDLTSIGCHTNLWDFQKYDYHDWVYAEGIAIKLAPIVPYDVTSQTRLPGIHAAVGIGLHDSSAALIPYMVSFHEPFVLISTGTWCISLNPFNSTPLTVEELKQDSLCYMHYQGKPVKASRLFAGKEHEEGIKRMAAYFGQDINRYKEVAFNAETVSRLQAATTNTLEANESGAALFGSRDLASYQTYEEAYHQLILDLITQQVKSTQLVLNGSPVKRLFVDGGFSQNPIYMNLLAIAFPHLEVYAASMAQATALGAALAIHKTWNTKPLPNSLIRLQYYSIAQDEIV